MDKKIMDGEEFDISIKSGDMYIEYAGKGGSVILKLESDYFLDKLKDAIPGKIDDAVIDMLKAAFLN